MSSIIGKARTAFRNPEDIGSFLHKSVLAFVELLKKGRLGALFGLFTAGLVGRNIYISNLSGDEEGLVEKTIHGNRMLLDPSDQGISHDLLTFGGRERAANAVYRQQLSELRKEIDGEVTVFEIGGNIGYYALQAADILGENTSIYIFEPSGRNIELLTKNIELNGFDNSVDIFQGAIGDQDSTVNLLLAKESNLHTVDADERNVESEGDYVDTIEVPMNTVDGFLQDNGIPVESVNVIRMDLEGYEANVLKGMQKVLEVESHLLIFVELHPHRIGVEETNRIIEAFDSNGFELISATRSIHREPYEKKIDASSLQDLYDMKRGARIIIQRK